MNDQWFEKIEDYLNGTLKQDEKAQFETELAQNEELASVFAIYKAIDGDMQIQHKYEQENIDFQKTLEGLSEAYFSQASPQEPSVVSLDALEKPQHGPGDATVLKKQAAEDEAGTMAKRIPLWTKLAVAASLLGVIVLSSTWFFQNKKENTDIVVQNNKADRPTVIEDTQPIQPEKNTQQDSTPTETGIPTEKTLPVNLARKPVKKSGRQKEEPIQIDKIRSEDLFTQNFQPDSLPKDIPAPLQEVFSMFRNREYKKTITAINENGLSVWDTRGDQSESETVIFYTNYIKGSSYLALDSASKAIEALQKAQSDDPYLEAKKQWYLALAFLKAGEPKKTMNLLQQLAGNINADEYRAKAGILLGELKRK